MRIQQKSRKPRAKKSSNLRKALLTTVAGLLLFYVFWAIDRFNEVRMPQSGEPAELYSNQTHDDLRQVLLKGIKDAKQSIFLVIYTLTDGPIIQNLKQKSEEGVDVKVVCDAKASPLAAQRLGPKVKVVKRFATGLMHQKILVVDGVKTWLGSANMTGESLRSHGNLIAAIHCQQFAQAVLEKVTTMTPATKGIPFPHRIFNIGGQKVELWFFPDDPHGVQKLTQLIRNAEKSVRVAMFTWTRKDLAEEIVEAKKRGVQAEVVIDRNSGQGVSAHVVKLLKKGGVPVRLNNGTGLLHHKFVVIDSKTLVHGSANWTKAAFTKNDDCYMILHDLTERQKLFVESLWAEIQGDSTLVK